MALFKRYQPPQPAPVRPPDEDGLLNWILREVHPFLIQTQRYLSRCISYMGMGGVDTMDFPGVHEDKLVSTTGVTITKIGSEGSRQLQFGANAAEITNVVNITNVTNTVAATTGATLFPCNIPDALLRDPCVGLLPHGEGVGFGTNWTQIDGLFMWRFTGFPGAIVPNGGTARFEDGDRALAWSSIPFGAREPSAYGIYEIVDCGYHLVQAPGAPIGVMMGVSTTPVIRRSSDANTPSGLCHNMAVQIAGRDAVEHNGDYFTLTTADPIVVDTTSLAFTYSPTRTSGAATNLLTPAQTAAADLLTLEAGVACSTGTNDVAFFADGFFVTLSGTPGAATIPAGPWTVYAKLRNASAVIDLATPPRVDFKFIVKHVDGSVDASFLTCSSPPLTSATAAIYSFQGNLAAAVTISPSDRCECRMYGHATGAAVQNIHVEWQNPTRDTRIVTTLSLGGFPGSGIHNDLTGRSATDCHPISAITGLSMAACGRYDAILGDGILSELTDDIFPPESQPPLDSGAITSGSGVVTITDGTFTADELMTIRWPAGLWNVKVTCAATSLASASYVRATLYRVDTGTPTAIGWTHYFQVASTDTANGAVVAFGIVLPELIDASADRPYLRLVLQAKTDSGAAVHVYVMAATIETPMMIRQWTPTLAQLGGVPTARTINGLDLTANRDIPTAGRLVARTIYTTGISATHTFTDGIAATIIEGIASGGGGGGGQFNTPNMAFGGGGGAGGYFSVRITGTFTTATHTVGTAGIGGSNTGGDGDKGNDTVVVCNGVTYTAKGGLGGQGSSGGIALRTTLGGAGVTGTNGDIMSPGACGQYGIRLSGILGGSGAGAPGPFGGGGAALRTNGAGLQGLGAGSGGGGAAAVSSSQSGGNGQAGMVIYEEYSA